MTQTTRATFAAAFLVTTAALAPAPLLAQDAPSVEGPSTESIGVNLNGLVLLGPTDPVRAAPAGQVTAAGLELIDSATLAPTLQPLIGQPISQAMISEIEAAIVRAYRAAGYPFVAVATPPQEITSGILNLRVVPFRAAGVTVTGTDPENAARITAGIRQEPGTFIAARQLEEDLTWLNRSPRRLVAAEFTPGIAPSTTDITLAVTESPRWQFSAGISNTGSVETGEERLSFGVIGSDLLLPGDAFFYRGAASLDFGDDDLPAYLGHTLQYIVPIAPRQELAILATLTETTETPDDVFVLDSRTEEITVTWTSALSNFAAYPGEISVGLENRVQRKELFFGEIFSLGTDVFATRQLTLGWGNDWRVPSAAGPLIAHSLDLTLHLSPGDIGANNGDDDLAAFTLGRATSARYAYLTANYNLNTRLADGRRVSLGVNGQLASDALPDTEQLGIGGLDAVRGYAAEDGAYDSGVILRSELGLLSSPWEQGIFSAQPFVFLDAGVGHDIGRDETDTFAGIGVGASLRIGTGGTANVALGVPLVDGPANDAGEPRFQINFNYRF
jgi:hemolysin activation/secretion protein